MRALFVLLALPSLTQAQTGGVLTRLENLEKELHTRSSCQVVCVADGKLKSMRTNAGDSDTALELAFQRCILNHLLVGSKLELEEIKVFQRQPTSETKIAHDLDGKRVVATTANSCRQLRTDNPAKSR